MIKFIRNYWYRTTTSYLLHLRMYKPFTPILSPLKTDLVLIVIYYFLALWMAVIQHSRIIHLHVTLQVEITLIGNFQTGMIGYHHSCRPMKSPIYPSLLNEAQYDQFVSFFTESYNKIIFILFLHLNNDLSILKVLLSPSCKAESLHWN